MNGDTNINRNRFLVGCEPVSLIIIKVTQYGQYIHAFWSQENDLFLILDFDEGPPRLCHDALKKINRFLVAKLTATWKKKQNQWFY